MKKVTATQVFETLSSGIRLDTYRLLAKQGPEGLVAGQIATALKIPPNNLSFHLKIMTHCGILTLQQEGRFQRYRANIPLMLDLIAYLTEECCVEHPEQCAEMRSASKCSPAVLPPITKTQKQSKPMKKGSSR
jgi:ArsR family transcriptional regulator, arsenate/arsenite/antimonite-responsive transcriptional repressor